VETGDGLLLVDSGIGLGAVTDPQAWLGSRLLSLNRPLLDQDETALRQVRLGYDPADVRHIVLTHLDRDHAGGIADFPHATIYVYAPELSAAQTRTTEREQSRYLSQLWAHQPRWVGHDLTGGGERWFGFGAVRPLPGLPEIALVPLAGHTRGHAGVAIDVSASGQQRWLLHAGDAYFFHAETDPHRPHCSPGLTLFQHLVQHERETRRRNQQRLRELVTGHGAQVTVFSAHDPIEFDRFTSAQALAR
jgi:glyoxylase-like metal-dependent hydrolase (beta-lactamase superfamily II)